MDCLAAVAICTEPFVPAEDKPKEEADVDASDSPVKAKKLDDGMGKRISRRDPIFKLVMWRNILPVALY